MKDNKEDNRDKYGAMRNPRTEREQKNFDLEVSRFIVI